MQCGFRRHTCVEQTRQVWCNWGEQGPTFQVEIQRQQQAFAASCMDTGGPQPQPLRRRVLSSHAHAGESPRSGQASPLGLVHAERRWGEDTFPPTLWESGSTDRVGGARGCILREVRASFLDVSQPVLDGGHWVAAACTGSPTRSLPLTHPYTFHTAC